MKKILLILILINISLFANIGKVTAVHGKVFITNTSGKIVAKSGSILKEKDIVSTKDNSKALLLFNDKTTISIGKNSELSIEEYLFDNKVAVKNKANFKFNVGVFRTITGVIGKLNKEKFTIRTKSASIGIRGTVFLVEIKQNTLRVGVEDGRVFVVPLDKKLPIMDINQDEALTYNDQTKELKVVPLSQWKEANEIKKELKENTEESTETFEDIEIKKLEKEITEAIEEWNVNKENPNKFTKSFEDLVDPQDISNENHIPTLSAETLTVDEDTTGTLQVNGSDIDGDTLIYNISANPLNGSASIDSATGLITYIPTSNFYGTDTITVSVSDGKGGTTTIQITIIVNNVIENIVGNVGTITSGIEEITGELLPQDNLDNLDFGFIAETSDIETVTDIYISGDVTPSEQIQSYILQGKTADYEGSIATIVDGAASTAGSVHLEVNFGTQNVVGNINVTQGNWQANINSGSVTPYGFNSTDISGTSDMGSITSGAVNGRFYGESAQNVGGNFQLSTDTKNLNGVFGATQ